VSDIVSFTPKNKINIQKKDDFLQGKKGGVDENFGNDWNSLSVVPMMMGIQ